MLKGVCTRMMSLKICQYWLESKLLEKTRKKFSMWRYLRWTPQCQRTEFICKTVVPSYIIHWSGPKNSSKAKVAIDFQLFIKLIPHWYLESGDQREMPVKLMTAVNGTHALIINFHASTVWHELSATLFSSYPHRLFPNFLYRRRW